MGTYSSSIASGITLSTAGQNPVTIARTGTLAPSYKYALGVWGQAGVAWTIVNYGAITPTGSDSAGIYLAGGGLITNESGATISADASSGDGILLFGGGTVTNQSGGEISGYIGVFARNVAATVTNSGTIAGNATTGPGVVLLAGGSVTNTTAGIIRGVDGVYATAVASTVANAGSIDAYYGVVLRQGGAVTNSAGLIYGVYDGVITNGTNAATIVNQARILGANQTGVFALDGGVVSNASSGTIAGYHYGIEAVTAALTIINQGTIRAFATASSTTASQSGIVLRANGVVNNEASGEIIGYHYGVEGYQAPATVTNAGTIIVTATRGAGIAFFTGGSITNTTSGTIQGATWGVAATNVAVSVSNQGIIAGASNSGIYLVAGGYVSNASSGTVKGAYFGIRATGTTAFTAINQGSVAGSYGTGIYLGDGGTVGNSSSGTIDGYYFGARILGAAGSVANAGLISNQGTFAGETTLTTAGVELGEGGTVSNASSGTIAGSFFGVMIKTATGTVVNTGTIETQVQFQPTDSLATFSSAGVRLADGGVVTNNAGASIDAKWMGVQIYGGVGTVQNFGTIIANDTLGDGAGVWIASAGTIINAAGATISGGGFGIVVYNQTTLLNQGVVYGTEFAFDAVQAAGFAQRVIMAPGAVFSGTVDGGNTIGSTVASTLELASGASAGTLSGLGSKYIDFGNVTVDSGANWTLGGTNTLAGGQTLTNSGTINAAGASLTDSGLLVNNGLVEATTGTLEVAGSVSGSGTLGIASGAALRLDQSASAGQTIVFASGAPETLILSTPGSTVSAAITGLATGDRIELGAGETITSATFTSPHSIKVITTTGTVLLSDVTTAAGGALSLSIGSDTASGDSYLEANASRSFVWTGASSNNLGTASNWNDLTDAQSPATVAPGIADAVSFLSGDEAIVGSDTVNVVQFGSNGLWTFGAGAAVAAESGVTVGNAVVEVAAGGSITSGGSIDTASGTNGGAAQVLVSGTGAEWTDAGTLLLGGTGVGNLSIATGGTAISGAATIANTASASGSSASVTGTNAAWTIGGTLAIGVSGSGSLNIAAGGTVTAGSLITASTTAGSAVLSVSGTLSALNATGDLIIGGSGNADLDVTGGATIGAGTLDIGLLAGSSGVVDVEGASALFVTGTLNIGDAGNAVLSTGADVLVAAGAINIGTAGVFIQFGDPTLTGVFTNSNSLQVASGTNYITATVEFVNDGPIIIEMGALETITTPLLIGTGSIEINPTGELILNAGSVVGTQSIVFEGTSGGGTLQIGAGDIGQFGATVTAFQAGDEIILAGTSVASVGFVGNVATLFGSGGGQIGTLAFAGGAVSGGYLTASNGVLTEVACFAEGTRLATVRGEVAVEALREGDLVRTVLGGNEAAITWIGRRTVDCARHPQPRQVWPVRVRAGAFGAETPRRDLYLSPDHAVYVNEVLVPVRHLVNGTSIAQVMVDSVTYYHVELPAHDVVLAEGLAAESYLDMKDGSNYAKTPGPVVLYPDRAARMWEAFACAPLVVSGPELVAARARVHELARDRAFGLTSERHAS